LRGVGRAAVNRVQRLEEIRRQVGNNLVDSRVPRARRWKSQTCNGDGYITVRHPETETLRDYLEMIASTVPITYTLDDDAPVGRDDLPWRSSQRTHGDHRHCRPASDDDSSSCSGEG
jgi:hypothetical protein